MGAKLSRVVEKTIVELSRIKKENRYIIGYHGTTSLVADKIKEDGFKPSFGHWSWLGKGSYFFLEAEQQARKWADKKAKKKRQELNRDDIFPILIAAKIEKKNILNFVDQSNDLEALRMAYRLVDQKYQQLPIMKSSELEKLPSETQKKYRFNFRDFMAIERVVKKLEETNNKVGAVLAAFSDGSPIGKNSWIFDDAQIVISVRDKSLIKQLSFETLLLLDT